MRSDINHILAFLIGLAAFLLGMPATEARAQIISNIATIQWDAGPNRIVRNSNPVNLVVEQPPPTPTTLTLYQLQGAPGSQLLNVPTTLCQGSAVTKPPLRSQGRLHTFEGAWQSTHLPPTEERSIQLPS